nr:DEAD/DEAH box helicase family protein [Fusibacter sp. 3D3]
MTQADETHHSPADSYQRIVAYFTPKILLGLIATPERLGGEN